MTHQMSLRKAKSNSSAPMILLRVLIALTAFGLFIPAINPARVSGLINKNVSLFTCALSYSTIGENFTRALSRGWITQGALIITYIGALVAGLSVAGMVAAVCMSIGETKLKRLSCKVSLISSGVGLVSMVLLFVAYNQFVAVGEADRIQPMFPMGIIAYLALFVVVAAVSLLAWKTSEKPAEGERYEMKNKYRLFLMMLPFLALVIVFSYLPLWGWRYAFFDFVPGFDLSMEDFVGLKWLRYLFGNAATRSDIFRVLKNTFGLSGLGIITSWLPMMFAIFLSGIHSNKSKRIFQTFTTIPNFISWVLVYTVAFALFSTEGFINSALINFGVIEEGTNYLMSGDHIWLKMWAWNTWKTLGWQSIIYIAAISGIDQQLYEAATVDGAGRFRKMWSITIPSLLPTFFVMLLMAIANILTNGMDQYLVFYNAANHNTIQVLDLYVYQLGLATGTSAAGNIPLATLIGMLKSLVSVTLLFTANKASKLLRGESIV